MNEKGIAIIYEELVVSDWDKTLTLSVVWVHQQRWEWKSGRGQWGATKHG